jgi:hypothetical protein
MVSYSNFSLQDMEGEIWKDVVGYENLYKVSNYCRIKSLPVNVAHSRGNGMTRLKKEIIIKTHISTKTNYGRVCLCKDNVKKSHQLHRIIAMAFIPNPQNKETVNHINGVKWDNSLENLEWATVGENNRHKFEVLKYQSKKKNKLSRTIYKYSFDGKLVSVISGSWDVCLKYRKKAMNVCFGYNNSFDNHVWSFVPLEKIDKNRIGRGRYKIKTVYQKGLDGTFIAEYNGIKDASIKTGVSKTMIFNCVKGQILSAKGYVWSYKK